MRGGADAVKPFNTIEYMKKEMTQAMKRTARAVLKSVTAAALLSGALASNVTAEDAKIKDFGFSVQPV